MLTGLSCGISEVGPPIVPLPLVSALFSLQSLFHAAAWFVQSTALLQ